MTLTPEGIRALKPDTAALSGGVVGTLTDSYEWYFVLTLPLSEAERVKKQTRLQVYFPQMSAESLTVSVERAETYGDETVMVLRSGVMDAQYLTTRRQPVDVVVASYTGVKVPRQAMRQVDGVWGVYCLEGAVSRFKPVDWVYQTDAYYLAPLSTDPNQGLHMYDQIILSGQTAETAQPAE
jgi:hypothetical protein